MVLFKVIPLCYFLNLFFLSVFLWKKYLCHLFKMCKHKLIFVLLLQLWRRDVSTLVSDFTPHFSKWKCTWMKFNHTKISSCSWSKTQRLLVSLPPGIHLKWQVHKIHRSSWFPQKSTLNTNAFQHLHLKKSALSAAGLLGISSLWQTLTKYGEEEKNIYSCCFLCVIDFMFMEMYEKKVLKSDVSYVFFFRLLEVLF